MVLDKPSRAIQASRIRNSSASSVIYGIGQGVPNEASRTGPHG